MQNRLPRDKVSGAYPSHNEDVARGVRLECLRLAAETGMKADLIQTTADQWTDFVLGTSKVQQ